MVEHGGDGERLEVHLHVVAASEGIGELAQRPCILLEAVEASDLGGELGREPFQILEASIGARRKIIGRRKGRLGRVLGVLQSLDVGTVGILDGQGRFLQPLVCPDVPLPVIGDLRLEVGNERNVRLARAIAGFREAGLGKALRKARVRRLELRLGKGPVVGCVLGCAPGLDQRIVRFALVLACAFECRGILCDLVRERIRLFSKARPIAQLKRNRLESILQGLARQSRCLV